jgi:hypothetical protein
VFSIFEDHTDIIIKDRRDTHYGHKICLTGGASNLILDCVILEGNPADTELVETMLDRQKRIYGRYPLKVALDGGFASKDNLVKAKERKIKDVCFSKKRGLKEADMCRSDYVYKKLRQFRAGIESGISWLKRSFGSDPLHLERISFVQKLCVVIGRCRQFAYDCTQETGGCINPEVLIRRKDLMERCAKKSFI